MKGDIEYITGVPISEQGHLDLHENDLALHGHFNSPWGLIRMVKGEKKSGLGL